MARAPAQAGRFYPADPDALRAEVSRLLGLGRVGAGLAPARPLSVIVPHAGYQYSGHVAGALYGSIQPAPVYVILGPNHSGAGARTAIMSRGHWETPLGLVPVCQGLAVSIMKGCDLIEESVASHQSEHAIEVQLPFLQALGPCEFVPIAMADYRPDTCRRLGDAVAAAVRAWREAGHPAPLLIASTDLNHYEPDDVSRMKDKLALDAIQAMDPDGLLSVCDLEDISMCGVGPTAVILHASKALGASHAELVRYANSGEVTGDRATVVGYASLRII